MGALVASDRVAGRLASAATTLGQLALLCLGVHLAADRLDDVLVELILALQAGLDLALAGPLQRLAAWLGLAPERLLLWERLPLAPLAAGLALAVEVFSVGLLATRFLLTDRAARPSWRGWWQSRSLAALVMPLSLAGVLVAGSWSMAMAVEDLLPASALSRGVGALVGGMALLRFGLPAWRRAVAALDPHRPFFEGALPALALLPIGGLAWVHGLPIWGPLQALLQGGGAP